MADVLFVAYPRCSTCKKAQKWLDERGVAYTLRDIVEENPSAEELAAWLDGSDLAPRKLFNTSGRLYRERGLKAQLDAGMSAEDMLALLGEEGMLVKRPLLVVDGTVRAAGFREPAWTEALGL